jgi:hypothetical protein
MATVFPKSIEQFAQLCSCLSNEQIYELFDSCNQEFRDLVLTTFWSHERVQEPTRSAMRQMGERYSIKSLMEY